MNDKKKIRIGWFTFTCCGDSSVVLTEMLNDHWREWKELFEFVHFRELQSQNTMGPFDIVFIEGAIANDEQKKELMELRKLSKKLVAVGACAVMGLPGGQRNTFNAKQKQEIEFLLVRFSQLPKMLKVADVVPVDAEVPGCPMDPGDFLAKTNALVAELQGAA